MIKKEKYGADFPKIESLSQALKFPFLEGVAGEA
jgi:hypothetical protein